MKRLIGTLMNLVVAFAASAALAQDEPSWAVPRTSWGTPDFDGVWSNETLTPFERPVDQADKPYVTPEEAAAARDAIAAARARDGRARSDAVEPPPAGGNVGAYNLVWMDFGSTVVGTGRSSLVIDPPDGRVPVRAHAEAFRDKAKRLSFDAFEYMSPWDRCITRGMPGSMFPAGYNNYYRFLQTPNTILIYYEMIHEARVVPLDGRPRLGGGMQFWNGEPRGRWEGDTLVIESRGYRPGGWIANSASQRRVKGIPHTAELHVIERFKRISQDTILWRVTITDPAIYTRPWTVEIPLVSRAGAKIFEYACHEGNQAVGNILRGARVQAAAEGPQPEQGGEIIRATHAFDQLVPEDAVVEKVANGFQFIEGPVWVPGTPGKIVFSDIPADTVYSWSEADGVQTVLHPVRLPAMHTGGVGGSNGLALDPEGRLILCEHGNRRVARMESDGSRTTLADRHGEGRLNSPNDIVFHSSGAAFFTDPSYGLPGLEASTAREQPVNGVYRLDKNGHVTLLADGQTRPNGIGLAPDERTLYVANSDAERRVWMAYPVRDDLTLGKGTVFFDASDAPRPGVPDGLALDQQGHVFATGPGGVMVFNADGDHLGTIVPDEQPANVGWGDDGSTLYMTARTGLYRVRMNTRGLVYRGE